MEIKIKNNNEYIPATLEVVDGVMIVSPIEDKVDISQFKDGDVITCGWENEFHTFSWVCVLNGTIEECKDNYFLEEYCGTYLVGGDGKEQTWIDSYSDSATWVRYATEEEKQKLFDALAKEGKAWDAEKKAVVELKWKPKVGGKYYFISFTDKDGFTPYCYYSWCNSRFDKNLHNKGWVFRTKEECEAYCKRLNDVINEIKP